MRGKGVGRRAEALTIAKAFDEFGAHRVYGRIPACNEVAKRTVTSLGWLHEGTMRGHLAREGAPPDAARSGACSRTSSAPPPPTSSVSAPAPRRSCLKTVVSAAVSDDFFRSRPFLDAEGVTHTLLIESAVATSSLR